MRILVIDTALGACAAGLFATSADGVRALGVRRELMAKGHQERLGGVVRDAVADGDRGGELKAKPDVGGGFAEIDRIGVTVGPGSFTGLRVGLAFALGLGAALDRPVLGLSTLDGLAASVPGEGLAAAAIDARRGQVYLRLFRDGAPLNDAEALTLEAARTRIAAEGGGGRLRLIGSGAPVLAAAFPEDFAEPALHPLPAPEVWALAGLTATADPALAPPRPLYLRAPDATPPSRLPGQPRRPGAAQG